MSTVQFTYEVEENRPVVTSAAVTNGTASDQIVDSTQSSVFSPLAPPFESRLNNLHQTQMQYSHPNASANREFDQPILNMRTNNSDVQFDDIGSSSHGYTLNGNPMTGDATSAAQKNVCGDVTDAPVVRNENFVGAYDFLIKSMTSANLYVSMLNPEQLAVLSSMRPSVLYDFLQEVVKAYGNKRVKRLPNECAFCKNNGEEEECYMSHPLKDFRGRVLCPVLRAFRCPRCGATGDRAHTIKYCPENPESERSGGFLYRRRVSGSTFLMNEAGRAAQAAPPMPAATPVSPSASNNNLRSSIWSSFAMN
ncbi:PREDICTED: uncharacterized protein LOC106115532 isoform X2 [Papilio xuthus]|uniref:Uncharacterized protein LOC106115532 isoform X2 n=1 Tax=Papilio xuthus TaxID=66420 RepID=A0AAJ7E5Z1_PAPXU|nr:PREDICTED: uncharacterized protein LOC106115532 isoform X2 [Papilio xuthus]